MSARIKGGENEMVPVVPLAAESVPPLRHAPAAHPAATPKHGLKRQPPKWLWLAIGVVVVAAMVYGVGRLIFSNADGIDRGQYQAVFLTSSSLPSNVYFGKLERLPDGYYKLTGVYYLRAQTETTQQDNSNITLTKMSTELHSPDDSLILPREQVLYYQNMRADSKVVQAIKQDNQNN